MFSIPGKFTVTLTATDAAGNEGADQVVVTVLDTTPPVADAGPDLEMDQGQLVEFDASASTDNVGVTGAVWTFTHGGEEMSLAGVGGDVLGGAQRLRCSRQLGNGRVAGGGKGRHTAYR